MGKRESNKSHDQGQPHREGMGGHALKVASHTAGVFLLGGGKGGGVGRHVQQKRVTYLTYRRQ